MAAVHSALAAIADRRTCCSAVGSYAYGLEVMYRYPGTQHGFNNDTGPRYDEAAAKLAWQRTVNFFLRYLRK